MKKLLFVALMLSCSVVHAGKTTSLLLGAGAGAVAGYIAGQASKEQAQPPVPVQNQNKIPVNHSIIMCDSWDGSMCETHNSSKKWTAAQWAAKAGFKYIYRQVTITHGNRYRIEIEVSN